MTAIAILGLVWGVLGFVFGLVGMVLAIVARGSQRELVGALQAQGIDVGNQSERSSITTMTSTMSLPSSSPGGLAPALPGQEPTNQELQERELYRPPIERG